jgi:hypothetical protein
MPDSVKSEFDNERKIGNPDHLINMALQQKAIFRYVE